MKNVMYYYNSAEGEEELHEDEEVDKLVKGGVVDLVWDVKKLA